MVGWTLGLEWIWWDDPASSYLLKTPRTKLHIMGDRAFCSSAPNLWNALPVHLRTPQPVNAFKRGLKTYLLAKPLNKFIVGVVVLFNSYFVFYFIFLIVLICSTLGFCVNIKCFTNTNIIIIIIILRTDGEWKSISHQYPHKGGEILLSAIFGCQGSWWCWRSPGIVSVGIVQWYFIKVIYCNWLHLINFWLLF